MTNKIKLTPYQSTFYNEWKLDPAAINYNLVFDQTVASDLDIARLSLALTRFINDQFILNCHVIEIADELFWCRNATTAAVVCFSATDS